MSSTIDIENEKLMKQLLMLFQPENLDDIEAEVKRRINEIEAKSEMCENDKRN